MIISHKYKFIFIAVPKTASTSIHNHLRNYDPDCRYIYGNKPRGPKRFRKHSAASQVLRHLPKEYFSFCFVRNPWDRVASYHQMLENQNDIRDFERFVTGPVAKSQSYWCCNKNGEVMVDYIGRFENLIEDFANICENVGLPLGGLPQGKFCHWMDSKVSDYLHKFTQDSIDVISNRCKWEIDKFGYEPPSLC